MDQFLFITKISRTLLKVKNSLASKIVNDLFDNEAENHYSLAIQHCYYKAESFYSKHSLYGWDDCFHDVYITTGMYLLGVSDGGGSRWCRVCSRLWMKKQEWCYNTNLVSMLLALGGFCTLFSVFPLLNLSR